MTTTELAGNLIAVLNDDCIYQILERLSLTDLCLFSRTCKRIQALCDNEFRRKHRNEATEMVDVRIKNNGNLLVSPDQFYVKYFDNFIKNLKISSDAWQDVRYCNQKQNKELEFSPMANFVRTKCDENLQKISIRGYLGVSPSSSKEIWNFLCNVKVVEFMERQGSGEDEATFLTHCPNVTKLILRHWIHVDILDAILQRKYRRLTHFYYVNSSARNLNADTLKKFFQTNDNIKCVAWSFNYFYKDNDNEHAVKRIRTLDYAAHLEHCSFSIDSKVAQRFDDICSQLNVLCTRDNFKSLEIRFEGKGGADVLKLHVDQLSKWKQLTKIHLDIYGLLDAIAALRSLVHLRILVLNYMVGEYNWDQSTSDECIALVDSAENMVLPQIEEIQMENIICRRTISTFVMQIVRHWLNLKRIGVSRKFGIDTIFNVPKLNRAREKLKNACELTIFTNHEGNATNLNQSLVKLKFVEFEFMMENLFNNTI